MLNFAQSEELHFILCLGDSLTFGARDEFHSSYPAELSKIYWEKKSIPVYCHNKAISGETSGQLLKRAFEDISQCNNASLGLLMIGTNDTFLPQNLEIYQDNLRQIVLLMKHFQMKIGLGLLPPILGPGLVNYPKDGNVQVSQFNLKIKEIAHQFDCFIADFTTLGNEIIDTVHFGHSGYSKMAHIWFEAIEKNKALNLNKIVNLSKGGCCCS